MNKFLLFLHDVSIAVMKLFQLFGQDMNIEIYLGILNRWAVREKIKAALVDKIISVYRSNETISFSFKIRESGITATTALVTAGKLQEGLSEGHFGLTCYWLHVRTSRN